MSAALFKIHYKHIVVNFAFQALDDGRLGLYRLATGSNDDRILSWVRMDRLTTEVNEVFTLPSLDVGAVDRVDKKHVIGVL